MQQVNIFKTKLYSLAIAAVALIGMFLPWAKVTMSQALQQQFNNFQNGLGNQIAGAGGGNAGGVVTTANGFDGWGYLTLVGIVGVLAVVMLIGDKTKDFDKQGKQLAMGAFLAIAAGALAFVLKSNSDGKTYAAIFQQKGITWTFGMGVWISLAAGAIGLLWLGGVFTKLMAGQTAAAPATTITAPPTNSGQ